MKASVILERSSDYEILDISSESHFEGRPSRSVLILHKVTETGSPFLVVAGYFLKEAGKFEESVLAEIETVAESDYEKMKEVIRKKSGTQKRTPITFW